MARESTGQVLQRNGKQGTTYAARVRAHGERHYLTLGHSWKGYTRRQAETELQNILADIRRGTWTPPQPAPVPVPAQDPTFHEFASQWFESHRHEVAPRSVEDYQWALTRHLLPFFKDHHLTQITIAEVDRYKTSKVRHRERGHAERTLSNRSINATLALLSQILELAVEYGHIQFNPARGRRRRLKAAQPKRTWLEPEQVKPLLDSTVRGQRGGKTTPDPKTRILLATGICTGLRISELLALRWQEVNLAQGRLTVLDSKTEAGAGREIDIWPELRDELAAYKTQTKHGKPEDYVSRPRPAKPTPAPTPPSASNAPSPAPTNSSPTNRTSRRSPSSSRRTRCDAPSPRCSTYAARTPSTSCTRWDTPTPSSRCASTPRSWASNAAAAQAPASSAYSTAHAGHRAPQATSPAPIGRRPPR
jgi:integrase